MHREQVEAIVQEVIEQTLGNTQMLRELHMVLKKANANTLRPEDATDALNAGLIHSLFLSHARLAQMVSELVAAHQHLQERVNLLEKVMQTAQEAVIDLQGRVKEEGK